MNMRKIFMLLGANLHLASCAPQAPKEPAINTLTETETAEGWKLLFNGKDLTNWKKYNGGEVSGWKIEEGILHIRTYRTPGPWRAHNVQEY
jgi:hypothetical protein